jgi:hypothetical protein
LVVASSRRRSVRGARAGAAARRRVGRIFVGLRRLASEGSLDSRRRCPALFSPSSATRCRCPLSSVSRLGTPLTRLASLERERAAMPRRETRGAPFRTLRPAQSRRARGGAFDALGGPSDLIDRRTATAAWRRRGRRRTHRGLRCVALLRGRGRRERRVGHGLHAAHGRQAHVAGLAVPADGRCDSFRTRVKHRTEFGLGHVSDRDTVRKPHI